MGTRGLWGFVIDGEEKLTYNHFDSYPSGLGQNLLDFLRVIYESDEYESLREQARNLRLVDEDDKVTDEDIKRLHHLHDGNVSTGEPTEWYSLLRNAQGDPVKTLDAGVMTEGAEFAQDSLFCEWAYVIDLDTDLLEIYQGFQEKPHKEGRFADRFEEAPEYYPVKLIDVHHLADLPSTITDPVEDD